MSLASSTLLNLSSDLANSSDTSNSPPVPSKRLEIKAKLFSIDSILAKVNQEENLNRQQTEEETESCCGDEEEDYQILDLKINSKSKHFKGNSLDQQEVKPKYLKQPKQSDKGLFIDPDLYSLHQQSNQKN